MKYFYKLFLTFFLIYFSQFSSAYAEENQSINPEQMRAWIQTALHYGFNMQTTDYTKYMSSHYIERIDGKTFNFSQWVHHMNSLKILMQSYRLTFNDILVEDNKIAASYIVHAQKKDGSHLDIQIIAIFTIKNNKLIYCDELTHLLKGPTVNKELADHD